MLQTAKKDFHPVSAPSLPCIQPAHTLSHTQRRVRLVPSSPAEQTEEEATGKGRCPSRHGVVCGCSRPSSKSPKAGFKKQGTVGLIAPPFEGRANIDITDIPARNIGAILGVGTTSAHARAGCVLPPPPPLLFQGLEALAWPGLKSPSRHFLSGRAGRRRQNPPKKQLVVGQQRRSGPPGPGRLLAPDRPSRKSMLASRRPKTDRFQSCCCFSLLRPSRSKPTTPGQARAMPRQASRPPHLDTRRDGMT